MTVLTCLLLIGTVLRHPRIKSFPGCCPGVGAALWLPAELCHHVLLCLVLALLLGVGVQSQWAISFTENR